ncbi:CMRF35-like molecule 7 isoform X2 [Cyprinus carpio]|uniref:CMRF35-like molecule 7 isoform X2 n=1 Tax=Cyprinus carpio TaxID=7962 RepID=A0A9Q9VGQ3_CYPCA|nr:CMRF35-like molecule 7 isoform X2 [Cyprinus carpio]
MKFFCALWLWMFLSEFNSTTGEISRQGHSEGSITITCSHSWASTNIKYFCRDPCKDILMKSDQSPTGRYRLKDSGEGTFTVNITDLQESDSGIYWCGVDRFGFDTFTKVKLTVSKGFVKASGPAGEKAGAEHRNSSSSAHIFPVPLYYIPYAAAGLAIMVIICAAGLVTVLQCRKRVKKSRCVIARSIYNSRHNEETNAVYQNAPDDRPYATINKSSTKSKDESQSDPIYQNIHFNTTQEETIYGNL